jgi:hypothetical protein
VPRRPGKRKSPAKAASALTPKKSRTKAASALSATKAIAKAAPALKIKKTGAGKSRAKFPSDGQTHDQLNKNFRAFGRLLASLPTGTLFDVPPETKHRSVGVLANALKRQAAKGKVEAGYFDDWYRKSWKNSDELIPTSAIREIVFGVIEVHQANPLSQAKMDDIETLLSAVSRVRLPTKSVGYAFSATEILQHPPPAKGGYFAMAQTAALHFYYDNQRKNEIHDAIQAELKAPGATAASAMQAGLRAAIAYSLNEMAAPITAADVKPFSMKAAVPDSQLIKGLMRREKMKAIFVSLGGIQDPDDPIDPKKQPHEIAAERRGRDWRSRHDLHKRSASPTRKPPSASAMGSVLTSAPST